MQHRIDKREAKGKSTDKLESKLSESKAKVGEIDGLLADISSLRSSTQDYHVTSNWTPPGDGTSGETSYNPETGSVDVNISTSYGLGGLAHELTHAAQFENGQTDLKADGSGRGFLHDLSDEVSAFKRQYAIDGGSLGNVGKILNINEAYVKGLNKSYETMPGISLNTSSHLQVIFMAHRLSNPAISYYPMQSGIKTYKDSKTLFNAYISK